MASLGLLQYKSVGQMRAEEEAEAKQNNSSKRKTCRF